MLASLSSGIRATGANVGPSNLHVRGDSLGSLNLNADPGQGLLRGDVTRDFTVDADDLNIVLLRYHDGPGLGWDQGDVNDDGVVNADDLNQVLLHFADSSVPPGSVAAIAAAVTAGDNNGDGDVDGNDLLSTQRGQSPGPMSAAAFNDWLTNFGTGSDAVAAATATNSAVPEPHAVCLMTIGALTLRTARRRTSFQSNQRARKRLSFRVDAEHFQLADSHLGSVE